eukprot:15972632-Heterocapsa_arctica.AAC.1
MAGCGFAVHYLKAMIKKGVKEEGKELRDFVDDMVLFKESVSEIAAVEGIMKDLDQTKSKPTGIGQRLKDGKNKSL